MTGGKKFDVLHSISTQSSSGHVKERDLELWGTLEQDLSHWFQQKTIKVFLVGLFKFARERLNVRRVWRVSGFPRHVEVNTAGRFLKQHLND